MFLSTTWVTTKIFFGGGADNKKTLKNNAFKFMQIAVEQMTNGENGIFTLPVANTKSNVRRVSDDQLILGMFNMGAVSSLEVIVE